MNASDIDAAGEVNPSPRPGVDLAEPRPTDAPPLRYLNQQVLEAAGVFSGDIGPRPVEPSTLDNPRIVEDMHHGYD